MSNWAGVVELIPSIIQEWVLLIMAALLGALYIYRLKVKFCSTIPNRIRAQQAVSMLLLVVFYVLIIVYPNPDKLEIKIAFSRVAILHFLSTHIWVQIWSLAAYRRRVAHG